MNFEFAAPSRIIFGEGRLGEAAPLASTMGSRVLVVEGGSGRGEPVVRALRERGLTVSTLGVPSEPTIALVERGSADARAQRCDVVVAIGGGSVIDTGKAIAALITNVDPVRDYLEVIGKARPLTNRSVPLIAIPTTAGTGSEVTRNAVLMAEAEHVKVSMRGAVLLPTVALIDPELTYTLPPAITASTGLDALTQCLEPLVSPQANPLSDAIAREGIRRAATALRLAFYHGRDACARRDMSIASLCGGLALANAKLGAVHGFAAPLCGMFPIPHGVACARLLAPVVSINVRALRARDSASPSLARFDEIARVLVGNPDARGEDAAVWLADLVRELDVPRLSSYGIERGDIARITAAARQASSMKGNPIELTEAELTEAMEAAL